MSLWGGETFRIDKLSWCKGVVVVVSQLESARNDLGHPNTCTPVNKRSNGKASILDDIFSQKIEEEDVPWLILVYRRVQSSCYPP